MSKKIRCFLVTESGRTKRSLRRYQSSDQDKCGASGYGYHNAHAPIEDGQQQPGTYIESTRASEYEGDPRWPTHCACGYEFQPKDERQVFTESIYRRDDTGEEWTTRTLPPGAMYDAWWYRGGVEREGKAGPDGLNLVVCLPPGGGNDYWYIDGPANNGPGWTRSGTVPNVTANPSILTPRYHGWLRDGVLVEC